MASDGNGRGPLAIHYLLFTIYESPLITPVPKRGIVGS